jgi:hypothetical protein
MNIPPAAESHGSRLRGIFWLTQNIIPEPDCKIVDGKKVHDILCADMIRSSVVLGLVIVSLTS